MPVTAYRRTIGGLGLRLMGHVLADTVARVRERQYEKTTNESLQTTTHHQDVIWRPGAYNGSGSHQRSRFGFELRRTPVHFKAGR